MDFLGVLIVGVPAGGVEEESARGEKGAGRVRGGGAAIPQG